MAFPIKVCKICGKKFELRPGKPGFATHCPSCSEGDGTSPEDATGRANRELNAARRDAIRDLLYRKDS